MSPRRWIGAYASEDEHREVHRLVLRAVVVVAVTAAGAAWLAAKGPVKVIIGTREIDEFAPTWYMLAAFPVLGMLLADVLDALLACGLFAKRTVVLGASAALLVVVSNLRLGIRLPISGHVLLMTYFLALRARARGLGLAPVARPAVVAARVEAAGAAQGERGGGPPLEVGAHAGREARGRRAGGEADRRLRDEALAAAVEHHPHRERVDRSPAPAHAEPGGLEDD